jgi:hypothetical protein
MPPGKRTFVNTEHSLCLMLQCELLPDPLASSFSHPAAQRLIRQ